MWILPKQLHTLASVQDTEGLSLDLNESSQLCAQSLFVRSKLSPLRTWLQKWKRDSWTQHLFGRILKPSLGKAFEIEWTSLLAVTPVSPLAQQESEQEKTTQGTFGPGLQMELLQCDQNYVSLKTSKDISRWGCPTLSKTWQEWVIERRGAYSARLNVVRRTSGSECSLWPTIRTSIGGGPNDGQNRISPTGQRFGISLASKVAFLEKNWPTAMARDWKDTAGCSLDAVNPDGSHRNRRDRLVGAIAAEMFGPPAPDNHSTHGSRPESWATPQSRDAKGAEGRMIRDGKSNDLPSQTEVEQTGVWNRNNGKLNPRWVEALMGLPIGWTLPSCTSPVTIAQTSCASSETA